VDYKTGTPKTEEKARKDLQLGIYALAAREALELNATRMVYHSLQNNERVTAAREAKQLAAVRGAIGGGSSREQLQQQLRQQAERITALEKRLAEATEFPQPEQQRFAATATAMGLSHSQARELLGIVVKKNVPAARRSRGG